MLAFDQLAFRIWIPRSLAIKCLQAREFFCLHDTSLRPLFRPRCLILCMDLTLTFAFTSVGLTVQVRCAALGAFLASFLASFLPSMSLLPLVHSSAPSSRYRVPALFCPLPASWPALFPLLAIARRWHSFFASLHPLCPRFCRVVR